LDDGQVSAVGTVAELLETSLEFRQLWAEEVSRSGR